MSNLIQAVRDVRTEVQGGETLEDAIAFVAEETGINPALLARKVAESFGPNVATATTGDCQLPEREPRKSDRQLWIDFITAFHEARPEHTAELIRIAEPLIRKSL